MSVTWNCPDNFGNSQPVVHLYHFALFHSAVVVLGSDHSPGFPCCLVHQSKELYHQLTLQVHYHSCSTTDLALADSVPCIPLHGDILRLFVCSCKGRNWWNTLASVVMNSGSWDFDSTFNAFFPAVLKVHFLYSDIGGVEEVKGRSLLSSWWYIHIP